MNHRNMKVWAGAAFLCIGALGCGKSVNLGDLDPTQKDAPPSSDGNLHCGGGQEKSWRFVQPDPATNGAVDLLFVVDTSPSMEPKRSMIADTIPEFVGQLSASTNYRVAVMLAHGGASYYSGRLYTEWTDSPPVLDSAKMSQAAIQHELKSYLKDVESDQDEANGEAGLYSLMRGLDADRMEEARAAGFFRPGAALSIAFVQDENDLCFLPELNGFNAFPDYVPSLGGLEEIAYKKYCKAPGQTASNFPKMVYDRLRAFQGSAPLNLAAITHVDPKRVPKGKRLEDSIGHGFIELVGQSPNGVLIDISDKSYASGLTQWGNVVQTTLDLLTRFTLTSSDPVQPATLTVRVDGSQVASQYDASSGSVQIASGDAGKSGSVVEISACVGGGAPPSLQ